jgi:hypothetical protein
MRVSRGGGGRRWQPRFLGSVAGLAGAAFFVTPMSGGAGLPADGASRRAPPRCLPVSTHEIVPATAVIDTGEYTLTLVATGGVSAGASVSGRLWLVSTTTARDSEILAGTRKPLGDTAYVPLYGASNVDFRGVSALMHYDTGATTPETSSINPLRPGVVVSHLVNPGPSESAWALLVGTIVNNRVACDSANRCSAKRPTSGGGAVLDVYKITRQGFAGTWRNLRPDGATGYFCAVPAQFFPVFQSQVPHHAPPNPP